MATSNKTIKIISLFRTIAIAEGISFLILLLIAMPLKYYANFPEVVKYFGWAHGILFILYLGIAFEVGAQLNKGFSWLVGAFVASLLPLGTFFFDRQFQKRELKKIN